MVQKIRAIIGTVEDGAVITAEDVSHTYHSRGRIRLTPINLNVIYFFIRYTLPG